LTKAVRTFTVVPTLPPELERLRELAHNLRWSWHHDSIALFRRLDDDLWEATNHNPVAMLGLIDQSKLEDAAGDDAFIAHLDRVASDLDQYLSTSRSWFKDTIQTDDTPLVAYFSAEFGVTECLAIFAGGLGILAGDHLKSASDLGIPLVGIGLAYQRGYFRQTLDSHGRQQELPTLNDFENLPLTLERDPSGSPLIVEVDLPGRAVSAQIWRAQVGRIALYLLDTNLQVNTPEDREITARLYDSHPEMRIMQEILLGIGGYRALELLGIEPTVFHMNEGHAAFLALEHVRRLIDRNRLSFNEAAEMASASLVFTSHTPVSAGHDRFAPVLMEKYFGEFLTSLGISNHDFLALGRENPDEDHEMFTMTVLALKLSSYCNGVSPLHGAVTRAMFEQIWNGVPLDEIPIGHVSNGIHLSSWISHEMNDLYNRYLGPRFGEEPSDRSVWQAIERIPPEELWATHERRRERLVAFARRRVRSQLELRGASRRDIDAAGSVLDPEILTIGFARRFATYKRATLLLRDLNRLARILNHPERPVQILFAGKAHPRDEGGKDLIQHIATLLPDESFNKRIVLLEDYDMAVARYLVQGCDVWLNNPRRPWEASGTSGMKASANGVLNVSTLDGWWDEAWEDAIHDGADIGWSIGQGETYEDGNYQDQIEAEALYDLLEYEVAPAFYERSADGLPHLWLEKMQTSLKSLCYFFNTNRMVQQYVTSSYLPANSRTNELRADSMRPARELASWRRKLQASWPEVRIELLETDHRTEMLSGSDLQAKARVYLADLSPEDVSVELYIGPVDAEGQLRHAETVQMQLDQSGSDNWYLFSVTANVNTSSGRQGYTIRVVPKHKHLVTPFMPGCIHWASSV
jgi:glycogen phosphorylase